MNDIEPYLNDFATRCFRDVADRDYISSRMSYRAGLISQFHWSALQAFEKYFKAILLYNRIKAKNIGHDLEKAQEKLKLAPFQMSLSSSTEKFLAHLDTYGRFRYLETSYFVHGPKLVELDKAIWEIRRYCRVMNYKIHANGKTIEMFDKEIQRNLDAENRPYQEFRLIGGSLEKIIDSKSHPAKPFLIWQNGFFGKSRRKKVTVPGHHYAENSPLWLRPVILDAVLEYVYLPKEVISAYKQLQTNKTKNNDA